MLVIRDFIAQNGVRFSQLCDEGMGCCPLFYPTAYCSNRIWSVPHSTQREHLIAIQRLYQWADSQKIDIDERFASRELLSISDIDSLANYLKINRNPNTADSLNGRKFNNRLIKIKKYVDWLAGVTIKNSNSEISNKIERMLSSIYSHKMKTESQTARDRDRIEKCLSDSVEECLFELFSDPLRDVEMPRHFGQTIRNSVMLEILYETGMRTGELLSLKLIDFTPSRGGIQASLHIRRNHDDQLDKRVNQPVAKTLGRILPISDQLEKKIYDYLKNWRSQVPSANFNDESFIFITHKKTTTQGEALEQNAFYNALAALRKRHKRLKGLHPHLLRHHWNFIFSKQAATRGLTETAEAEERRYLMGWSKSSMMPAVYNQRHIQESAAVTGYKTANHTADRRKRLNL